MEAENCKITRIFHKKQNVKHKDGINNVCRQNVCNFAENRGMEQLVACQSDLLEVAGSRPAPATKQNSNN